MNIINLKTISISMLLLATFSCRSHQRESQIESSYGVTYPVHTYKPIQFLPSDLKTSKEVQIQQIIQNDGGVGYRVIYRGSLLAKAEKASPGKFPDLKLKIKLRYGQDSADYYGIDDVPAMAYYSSEGLYFYISSTCLEGIGGCRTPATPKMIAALSPVFVVEEKHGIKIYKMQKTEANFVFVSSDGQIDNANGLGYTAYFSEKY